MCRDYRCVASLDFKQSRDLAAAISWSGWSIQVLSGGRMTYVSIMSYRRGCYSCMCYSFYGLICFLLALIGMQYQWRRGNGDTYRVLLECGPGNYHSMRDKPYTTNCPDWAGVFT